jgi:hypothetical protein
MRCASASLKNFAVEPVPIPTTIPVSTSCAAATAAAFFAADCRPSSF